MSRARFGFAAHPEALTDLRELPARIRDLALLELQNLVHGSGDCLPLTGHLSGFHKVYVDPTVSYRMVVQFRDAPVGSTHRREIYLLAAGPREDYAVYRTAQHRVRRVGPAPADGAEARVRAARARSIHMHPPNNSGSSTPTAAIHSTPGTAPRKASR